MTINETVGHRIRQQREKLGLKQHDLAHALQVSPQAVSKWERGENAPDIALLIPLAKLLGVSTDSLLGYTEGEADVFEATVFCADFKGYAQKAQAMSVKALAVWINGFFFQLTEAVLQYEGIPVKYIGDGFLCFFSGPNHQRRAVQAALYARQIVTETLTIALHSGEIYLGAIGHPEYSRPDIMGDAVNIAFITLGWARQHLQSHIAATASVVTQLDQSIRIGTPQNFTFKGLAEAVNVYEIGDIL